MNEIYEVIQSFNEYLEKLPQGCLSIANMLRGDNIELAMLNIYSFSEGIAWLEEAVILLNKNDIDYKFDFKDILYFFEKINEGIEQKNYTEIATIFEDTVSHFFSTIEPISQLRN